MRTSFIAAVALVACAAGNPTIHMTTAQGIPAAEGTVRASHASNQNTALDIEVKHLALPARVAPGATTYVVWSLARGQDTPQNLGALRVDDDLKGTLKTVTPLRTLDVFITAEPTQTGDRPTGQRLLFASVDLAAG